MLKLFELRGVVAALLLSSYVLAEGGEVYKCTDGIWLQSKSTCYSDLRSAFDAANSNTVDTIYVTGEITVDNEIPVRQSTNVIGQKCGGYMAKVFSGFNENEDAIFRMVGSSGDKLLVKDITFENRGGGHSRCIRSDEYDVNEKEARDDRFTKDSAYSLEIDNCRLRYFDSKARGGAAIFLQAVESVVIKNSDFEHNHVTVPDTGDEERFGGGGTLWFQELRRSTNYILIEDSTFLNNSMEFEHGLGGAFFVGNCLGQVDIVDSTFLENIASDGGAVHIARVGITTTVNIDGRFERNQAREQGWGSRAAARDSNNYASNGRGLVANNRASGDAVVTFAGTFINNRVDSSSIFDSSKLFQGTLVVKKGTKFQGNVPGRGIKLSNSSTKLYVQQSEINNSKADLVYRVD
ncbi:hypothetical protein SARC_03478 [Sphaeroforma arctica JP610]|uniref:Right handed beta helix domain-containing protein n=1 Tax=Sphaeroforma arctica JP610 TaxID=667725 RepID=A0A0L0G5K2_9EUKA|nr:hypothetical protein SARC_03478 [Sphaeroforma arctica JP610]KNC84317.1 hypothetical protein SARC_03478 [Sphaeroforma arctica JP610]|eukprot:XP_014158219.1 hypothetical protein SARC_03478 [Sphaeroforma arctica JP610]